MDQGTKISQNTCPEFLSYEALLPIEQQLKTQGGYLQLNNSGVVVNDDIEDNLKDADVNKWTDNFNRKHRDTSKAASVGGCC